MIPIADLLFEAGILKEVPRSGFQFLGAGRESVAEHSFMAGFIAYVMSAIVPGVDAGRLITMCLVHDFAEARIGDLNALQKKYVKADEKKALADAVRDLPVSLSLEELMEDYNHGCSIEARLARDADQLALVLTLKSLCDIGYRPPMDWLPRVMGRIETDWGKKIAVAVMSTSRDAWWRKKFIDTDDPGE
jgi:putative hydrolase of HD superfamily